MSRDSKSIGERTEGLVLAALLRRGKTVLLPFGDNQRYDLLVDNKDGSFTRVQCKTGRLKLGSIRFNTYSTNQKGIRKLYLGSADAFGVYCPETDKSYLVPMLDVANIGTTAMLRVDHPKNNQITKIRMAAQYEI